MIYNWLKNKLSFLFSKHCLLCLGYCDSEYLLCASCESELPDNPNHCIICASPFATLTISRELVCGKCLTTPPYYTTSSIPFLYASPLKELIGQLKFHGNLCYSPLLANIFIRSLAHRKSNLPECIVPVPLHQTRLIERGFNQALEVSRIVSEKMQIPLDYSFCRRTKATPFQSGLSAKQRKDNLKNAFSVNHASNYKHVAIFDDVVTTGTTVNELAKQLKRSGVETVEVWAIARTVDKNRG